MKKILILLVLLILSCTFMVSADFELTGKLKTGKDEYISNESGFEGELVDFYNYEDLWFKLKNNLDYPDYYYFKLNYYQKHYDQKVTYDNKTIDFSGNYTNNFREKYRNKFKLIIKDKNYLNDLDKSYTSYSLNYQFRHKLNTINQYILDFKTQQFYYTLDENNDYKVDTYKIDWQRDINKNIRINFSYKIKKKEYFFQNSTSDNKYGQSFSIDFKYDL